MNRRRFLGTLLSGTTALTAGCGGLYPFGDDSLTAEDVFERAVFDGTEFVVAFEADADVETAELRDTASEETYESVNQPPETVRFPVVFPDRMETYISSSLVVRAETSDGWISQDVPAIVHALVKDVTILPDGRARFEIRNQGEAPLLVRFVGIFGDVPNPTVNPQSESFDRSSLGFGPGVIGVGQNRPQSPSRTDLVVSPEGTAAFETTYAPFAFPVETEETDCPGEERTATIAVVHASGGSAAYTKSYRLGGAPVAAEGQAAVVCDGAEIV